MSTKVGRNDPCPCGSGKKYKNCCIKAAVQELKAAHAHDGAVERAVGWLAQYHRKAFAAAIQEEVYAAVFGNFGDDEEGLAREAMHGIDEALWQQLQINLTEWLLAEGDIQVKGRQERVSELLLAPGGPLFEVAQRGWLEQLARRPLRLYDIAEVGPDSSLTLCDALDTAAAPLRVTERAGSRTLKVGMQLGARVMAVADGHQLSGAVYPFSMLSGRAMADELRALASEPGPPSEDEVLAMGMTLIRGWLGQYLKPAPLPDMVYSPTGEPLCLIADHFEVQDWHRLEAALAAQPDVQGERTAGWSRLLESEDGQTRPLANISTEAAGRRVALQTMTAGLADKARPWFEALAGDAVKFVLREVSDPKGVVSRARQAVAAAAQAPGLPEGLDPQLLADAIADVIKRSYANWSDEPIPALGGRTPRQAITDPAGLERVKGLLRGYDDGETQQSAQQGRGRVSYQFLWDALGLAR